LSRYTYSEGKLGKFSTIILHDSLKSTSVEIALRGATILNYIIPLEGGLYNIIDGYTTAQELEEQKGARSCIMVPFSNRVENGEYEWNGRKLKMNSPIPSRKEVIHGFARVLDFKIVNKSANDEKAELTLYSDTIRENTFEGYPFAVDIVVKFTLMSSRLLIDIITRNVGDTEAPCGCGWHPYFRTSDDGVDHLELTIPAEYIVKVNERLVPLEGQAAFSHVIDNPGTDYRPESTDEKIIGKRRVNYCFTGLKSDNDGFIRSSIFDPHNKLKISVFQKGGVFYAYTADEVIHRPRKAIALEPVQFITNAFNRTELMDLLSVKPGESSIFSFGVETEIQ